ncbi:hypothetical protein ICN18_06000 [Polynucleobacter sp. Ross1-W9]|uniref:hypothetical protein n=1 Tax=Polynucleobacter parvulilacunae TaxID=1855631 RepID=UPI001C0BAE24|nr:hypothetical protein [Polynucleobacter parvulilacunae]MBU3557178.1 hypothetical protein [Polynucleobacter parvulilacunae]
MPTFGKTKKNAEDNLRDAFERLKIGAPQVLPKGARVSQNNVAREAGSDASALRKKRYPLLIMEIQEWIEVNKNNELVSERQLLLKKRRKNREAKEVNADLKKQRDSAVNRLNYANLRILELSETVDGLLSKLDALQPAAKILYFSNAK